MSKNVRDISVKIVFSKVIPYNTKMKRCGIWFLFLVLLTGCRVTSAKTAVLPGLTLSEPQKISEIDKNYKRYLRNNTLVQIRGTIVYQSKALGNWAYVEDDTGMVLLNLNNTSPNFLLPLNKVGKTITVEGLLYPDDTVINEYLIVPITYFFIQ